MLASFPYTKERAKGNARSGASWARYCSRRTTLFFENSGDSRPRKRPSALRKQISALCSSRAASAAPVTVLSPWMTTWSTLISGTRTDRLSVPRWRSAGTSTISVSPSLRTSERGSVT